MFSGNTGLNTCSPQLLFPASCTVSSAVLVELFIWLHSEALQETDLSEK